MIKKLSLFFLILITLTSCLTTKKEIALTESQIAELTQAIKDTELTALHNIDLFAISSSCAETMALNDTILAYDFLPQYDVLVKAYRDSFATLFNKVLEEEITKVEQKIENLEIEDPILLLNSGYQSISWEVEKLYKYEIQKEIYRLLVLYQKEYLSSTFSALVTETMIWKTNQEVLQLIKEVETYPNLEATALESVSSLLTNALLSELSFAEQRLRTRSPLELIYEQ